MGSAHKIPYVCGPLTELPPHLQLEVKAFYSRIADLCEQLLGPDMRAFVPHEAYDPILHQKWAPGEIDAIERSQVCERTSLLIVCAIEPSWGGGIEVEMAYRSNVPAVLLCDQRKLELRKVSRLLRGNPAIKMTLPYIDYGHALCLLEEFLRVHAPALNISLTPA